MKPVQRTGYISSKVLHETKFRLSSKNMTLHDTV